MQDILNTEVSQNRNALSVSKLSSLSIAQQLRDAVINAITFPQLEEASSGLQML